MVTPLQISRSRIPINIDQSLNRQESDFYPSRTFSDRFFLSSNKITLPCYFPTTIVSFKGSTGLSTSEAPLRVKTNVNNGFLVGKASFITGLQTLAFKFATFNLNFFLFPLFFLLGSVKSIQNQYT